MHIAEIGEFGLIERLRAKLPAVSEQTVVGIGDDAAVFRPTLNFDLVMSTDMLVEDVHFAVSTMSWHDVGWKSLAASISDIAAMGAIPRQAVISLAIPVNMQVEELEMLYEGVADIAREYHVDVVGGDIVRTQDKLVLSVTMTGEVESGSALLRSGAKPGDIVFVTGPVGGSAAGLHLLLSHQDLLPLPDLEKDAILQSHKRPKPQVKAGRWLLKCGQCHALNDISDGIASEANEIARASGVCLEIYAAWLPIASDVIRFSELTGIQATQLALFGGEDYQLIGCMDPNSWQRAKVDCQEQGISLVQIGTVLPSMMQEAVLVFLVQLDGTREPLLPKGYNHFGG